MPIIHVATRDEGRKPVMADVFGLWAVHPTVYPDWEVDDDMWTVSHVGCGFAFVTGVSHEHAMGLVDELAESSLDWTLPNGVASIAAAHKVEGRRLREKYS